MSERLVTIATFHDTVAAALARNFLEGQGIPAELSDEETVAINWSLSGAIGGIKLQVARIHVERAEMLLEQVKEDQSAAEDEPPPPQTAIAAQDAAEELRSEREDKAPANKLADQLFRCAVIGLLFVPLPLYALWLMVSLATTEGKVSPKRRWKIWVSVLINAPIMALVSLPVFYVLGYFTANPGTPENPVWRRHEFAEQGISVNFPHKPFHDFGLIKNRYGDAHYTTWFATAKKRAYHVTLVRCSDRLAQTPIEQALKDAVRDLAANGPKKVVKDEPITHRDLTGREVILDAGKRLERSLLFVRGRDLIVASVAGAEDEISSEEANAFFRSLRIR